MRAALHDAQAVGDLAGLEARLDALTTTIDQQREVRREERARKQDEARHAKEHIADEAERLAHGNDWRNGANRMRQLLDEWKALPRLEKAADDALWRRFSTARTTYTRRRKSHFAEMNEQRETAQGVKERLVVEAEALSGSTEWGATAGKYRDLMRQWKDAGPAPKGVDDALWKRFRGAQDTFFGARDATNAELDREFAENAVAKEALLVEAEALVPVTDLKAAKDTFRDIADRWDAAGKVPRDRMKDLEGRMRKVEQAIRGHRGRPVAALQPGGPGPGRRHGRPARGLARRPGGQARQGGRRGQHQEGRRARRRHRGPGVLARRGPQGPRRVLRLTATPTAVTAESARTQPAPRPSRRERTVEIMRSRRLDGPGNVRSRRLDQSVTG